MIEKTFESSLTPLFKSSDLATHFVECASLNVGLSLSRGGRLVITDDLLNGTIDDAAAASMAAIVSQDKHIAHAAVISIGYATAHAKSAKRDKFEKLLELIEDQAFDHTIRDSIDMMFATRFRAAKIRELVRELGGTITPARKRYQAFLEVIKNLEAKKLTQNDFIAEFIAFTQAVAGKLDFGIFAICLERLFINKNISIDIKILLLNQIIDYPPLVRKELISSLLQSGGAPHAVLKQAHHMIAHHLPSQDYREILLVTLLKQSWTQQRSRQARKTLLQPKGI
jgi:hypothetical protein